MATITTQERTNITKLVVGLFNAAPGAAYLAEFTEAYQGLGSNLGNLAAALGNTGAFKSLYPSYLSSQEFANKFLSTLGLQGNQEAQDWVQAKVNAGESFSSVIFQALVAIDASTAPEFAAPKALLNNKTTVASYYSVDKNLSSDQLGTLQSPLSNVKADSDVSTPAAIDKIIGDGTPGVPGVPGSNIELTLGRDVINALQEGVTFSAPIVQNQLGGVANTFESGDVINAKGTGNKLVADVAASGLIAGTNNAPAISATTKNVQVVEFRSQNTGQAGGVHVPDQANIDAQKMEGVKEWWSVNSRSDLVIEDVRTRPEDTTIGMRSTDPEASFKVYFDPAQLSNTTTVKNSALTLTLDSVSKPGNLADVPVDGVGFYLNGTLFTLKSDAIGAAKTHTELLAALKAAAATQADLKDVTFTLNANNSITLVDPAGRTFKEGGWQFIGNQVPAGGDIKWDQKVGEPARGTELITTKVELDFVGRTSAGGDLDVGSLGDKGVQKFEVNVDRDSWLKSLKSTDHVGQGTKQFLEEVNLHSKGANGNLKLGALVATAADGRLANGVTDVRVLNAADFKGNLNAGIKLNDAASAPNSNAVGRYLDKSTTPVEFNYTGSQGADLLNIDVAAGVAEHKNFVLNVNAGAGDDRLVLKVDKSTGAAATRLNTISVDGGEGNNTIVVNADVGTQANGLDTFKSFKNFQNYEIEGGNHNFTNLTGVKSVVVATATTAGGAAQSTTLTNLPVDLSNITVTGKNQTFGDGRANNNQFFNTLKLEAAKSAAATVTLDNTALVDAKLQVAKIEVTDLAATATAAAVPSAVRTLNVASTGVAGAATTNVIGTATFNAAGTALTGLIDGIDALKVNTFNITGDHAVIARIASAANHNATSIASVDNLKVDASALTGSVNLWLNSTVVTNVDNVARKNVTLTGGTSTKDVLTFDGAVTATTRTTVSGFETVEFKNGASVDATNFSGVSLYKLTGNVGNQKIVGLKSVENIELSTTTATAHTIGLQTTQTGAASAANVTFKATNGDTVTQELSTSGFTTLNLKLDVGATANNKAFAFDLSKVGVDATGNAVVVGSTASTPAVPTTATNHFSKAALQSVVLTGGTGNANGTNDTAHLGTLSAVVKNVDVTGYKGLVTATIGNALSDTVGTAVVTTGNTTVKVGAYGINIADTTHTAGAGHVDTVTAFVFTTDAFKDASNNVQKWQISGFQGIKAGADTTATGGTAATLVGSLDNLTVLDVSALGIKGIQDLNISEAGSIVTIKSNLNHNFVIELTGTHKDALDLANFKFAV